MIYKGIKPGELQQAGWELCLGNVVRQGSTGGKRALGLPEVTLSGWGGWRAPGARTAEHSSEPVPKSSLPTSREEIHSDRQNLCPL